MLPDVGRGGLNFATAQWQRACPDSQGLEDARVRLWSYLAAKNGDSSIWFDDEDRALRALMCVLYSPDQVADSEWLASDSVDWFVDMLEQIDSGEASSTSP